MTADSSLTQYPFAFPLENSFAAEDFIITPCNAPLCEQLQHMHEPVILLNGANKSGKTHILHWLASKRPIQPIAAESLGKTPAESWMKKDHTYYIDGIEHITNEAALAQAINLARALPAQLIITSTLPVASLQCTLADLSSRIKAAYQLAMPQPDDALLSAALHKYLADLQWRCSAEVMQYIITRIPRDMQHLQDFVTLANLHALAEKRALTIPFAASILKKVQHVPG